MKGTMLIMIVLASFYAVFARGEAITHSEFQAVNASGEQIYTSDEKVTLEGVVLNKGGDYLDPAADDSVGEMFNISGQWQLWFQGEDSDHAGTAIWVGQLYNNLPWVAPDGGYSNAEWIAELKKLHAQPFGVGDRIRVTGYFLSYNGKMNINEQHNKNPDHDVQIEVLERGAGVPRPETVSLSQLKDIDDEFIFDPDRLSGCEYYQSRLVKIENVWFADDPNWTPGGELTITDGQRTFPLELGRGTGIYAGSNNLTEPFDVIGILDQESKNLRGGYLLRVLDYDGNGTVLASREHRRADLPGDTDMDGRVDFLDLARLAENWPQ